MYSGQRPEAIDSRWVFRIYAAMACLTGFLLTGWGLIWFGADIPGQPWGKAALIRVFGSIVMAAGFCAAGFAAIDQPLARRRGLFWFATAHAVVWLVVLTQQIAIWDSGLAEKVTQLLLCPVLIFYYLWATPTGESAYRILIGLFEGNRQSSAEQLRSQYERQIREVAKQEERNRLARDLHDSIKQQIFVIQTAAATAQARFDGDQTGAKQALDQIRGSAREAMTEMQVMLEQLRAAPLENTGLVESLKKQCEALTFRTGARAEFKLGNLPAAEMLPPGAHEAILRVAQEALANIARHARAGSVVVSLGSVHGHIELKVQDDGAGFDPNQSDGGQGIRNMKARAEEFGGTFELVSGPGSGTSVALAIPFTAAETPRVYRRKAAAWAFMLVISIAILSWTRPIPIAVIAIAIVGFARYLVAYRRAQMRSEAAQ
ncbi:MAG TPA: sensor histidine kinase [Bryobacteraceae bacterium]|nr:sensor histidine kinase [Bryobacteraceae bacterium]